MNAAATRSGTGNITPAVHLEFIQNQIENANPSATEEIEQYHRALYFHRHAAEWEKNRHKVKTQEDRVAFLEGRLKATQLGLSERTQLVPVSVDGQEDAAPKAPWNGWDLTMFVACAIGIVCLITFGVLNISFNLLESGLVTFRENPLRSYLWAALLPVGALAVKIGWDCLRERTQRDVYLWACLAAGMLGVLVWVAAYACVYPTLSKGVDEHIAALTVFDSAASPARGSQLTFAGAKWIDVITVGAQAVAEIFLSAVLGMHLTNLYDRHRRVRLARDPAYAQLDQERQSLEATLARERSGLAEASGNLVRMENELSALVAYSKSLFHRETARRQDRTEKRQIVLDQLSEHVRRHLDNFEPNDGLAANGPGAAAGRNHGKQP
jgi:hypothetical protein